MFCSVFTPSHDPTWLSELWDCLKRQTHSDFEWVVVSNGPRSEDVQMTVEHISEGDQRVRVIPADCPEIIGALKRFACDQCQGELLVEVDHDDLLTPDCLESLVAGAQVCPRASFLFSDSVTLNADGTSQLFITDNGWQHYDWTYEHRTYQVNRCFQVNPRSLSTILFAPNHVRCWTKSAYRIAGGHNPEFPLADDHEIMVRTYLRGVHFAHIPKPLYIHRLRDDSTSCTMTAEIHERSRAVCDRYLHDMIKEWCKRGHLPMLDLGGAHNCPAGYLAVDKQPPCDVKCDVLSGLPFEDSSVGCVRAFDFLEHVPIGSVVPLFNEIWRVLVPGGWLLTMTPAIGDDEGRIGRGAYQDPTHCSFWSSNNFWYVTNREYAKYVPEIRCRFQQVRLYNYYPSDFHRTHLIPYVLSDMVALKEGIGYFPGPVRI